MNDLDLNIDTMLSEVDANNWEMKYLKKSFWDLVTTIKFRKETYTHINNDAIDLMTLANAFTVFEECDDQWDMGICLNNIGNIHF